MRYPILYTLLLPILFIGSIIFFVYSVDKFGYRFQLSEEYVIQ
jgi:hypothetical protein